MGTAQRDKEGLPLAPGGGRIDTRSSNFWQAAFKLRTNDSGAWLCPELLRPVAEDILEAGKASLLLRTEQRCLVPRHRHCFRFNQFRHSCMRLCKPCASPAGPQHNKSTI